jgi:hypothetical protein
VIMVIASLVSRRKSNDCCAAVIRARAAAATIMPMSSGMNHPVAFSMRTSSTKILENAGITIPGTTSVRLTVTSKPTAGFEPRSSRSKMRNGCAFLPIFLNSAVGSNVKTIPVNARSSSPHINSTPSDGGIVDEDASTVDSLKNNEVIEIPMNDARHG